jgi:RNA polymerase sigma factor (sigma-70 family)
MFRARGRRAEQVSSSKKERATNDAAREFPPTEWGLVLSAGAESGAALERLCRMYWRPAYSFVRRAGYSRDDAHDLIQDFFASSIASGVFSSARPERGPFRTWLLSALTQFVRNRAAHQQRRDRCSLTVPLEQADLDEADGLVARDLTPDQEYERTLALDLIDRALSRLEREQAARNGGERFQLLKPWLIGQPSTDNLAEVGRTLGLSVNSVSVALHALRQRLRTHLHEEVSELLERGDDPAALYAEVNALIAALRAPTSAALA